MWDAVGQGADMSETADELARRTPPGQVLTTKWPVLTYGLTPRISKYGEATSGCQSS